MLPGNTAEMVTAGIKDHEQVVGEVWLNWCERDLSCCSPPSTATTRAAKSLKVPVSSSRSFRVEADPGAISAA